MKNKHKSILLIALTIGLIFFFWSILDKHETLIMSLAYLYGVYYTRILNFLDNDK